MQKSILFSAFFVLGLFFAGVNASQAGCAKDSRGYDLCGPGDCAKDSIGNVYCGSTVGGGAAMDSIGNVNCGAGECMKNSIGNVECSTVAGGWIRNSFSIIECEGSCRNGTHQQCVEGK